jgi:hypothetical protein
VRAFILDSDTAGASADDSALVVKEIKVKIYSGDDFTSCKNNKLNF